MERGTGKEVAGARLAVGERFRPEPRLRPPGGGWEL